MPPADDEPHAREDVAPGSQAARENVAGHVVHADERHAERQAQHLRRGDADQESAEDKLRTDDLARVLAGNMAMYIEWPHIDRRFKQVYDTMPGRYAMAWTSRNSDSDDDVN